MSDYHAVWSVQSPRIVTSSYERMLEDFRKEFRKVSAFLGFDPTDETIEEIRAFFPIIVVKPVVHKAREPPWRNLFFKPRRQLVVDDITRGVSISGTVTYAALQFAYYMGADPVILLGIDHSFAVTGPANKLVVNHGNYFGKGIKWNLPDLEESERGYRKACEVFEAHGRSVLDATVGGKLRLFEKIAIGDAIRICRA